jgi:hypothetical protein
MARGRAEVASIDQLARASAFLDGAAVFVVIGMMVAVGFHTYPWSSVLTMGVCVFAQLAGIVAILAFGVASVARHAVIREVREIRGRVTRGLRAAAQRRGGQGW